MTEVPGAPAAGVVPADPRTGVPPRGAASPYSTGGGGVTFERRIGAGYLALLLTGAGAPEIGDGRVVFSVAFQQAPRVPVDDLVILAGHPDETEPSLQLAIGVRRAPDIVPSDEGTQKLITEYVRALLSVPADGRDHRWALVVAGPQAHAGQLADLAGLAADQRSARGFFELAQTSGKFRQTLVDRLGHLEKLVAAALPVLGITDADSTVVQLRTWELLSRLTVLMPRVEQPDVSDWFATRNSLVPVARGHDLGGASHLLDRLEVLAGEFGPAAADVNLTLLRRRVHSLLEPGRWRRQQGWALLGHLQEQALAAVRHHVGSGTSGQELHLDRGADGTAVFAAADGAAGMVVHGESGVGKSALVLEAAAATGPDPAGRQVVVLNLRQLPELSLELVASLGCSLEVLLGELSAPSRYLVVDGADAAAETRPDIFSYLARAASAAGVQVVAVSATENWQAVRDLMAAQLPGDVSSHLVGGLTDAQLSSITAAFPGLARLAGNARSRELLRRLVIVDLLVRSDVSGVPLSDVDAMREIWAGLVRNRGRRNRGQPDAREQVLLRLAARELSASPALEVAASLDAAAVDGLRQDGLLRMPPANSWQVIPDFAHDEVRRYAVARVLLASGDPAAELLAAGAPRWALAAGRLACQALLAPPGEAPPAGRFGSVQAAFDSLAAAGHGTRWGDVPGEALLTLGDPGPVLADAWAGLRGGDAAGLRRLLRLIGQRHRNASGAIDPAVAEPVVALLLAEAASWRAGAEIARIIREWLLALVLQNAAAGHPLRVRLQDQLAAACTAAEARLAADREAAAAARAARTPEQIEAERRLRERHRALFTEIGYGGGSRRQRPEIPQELTDETTLELLALLGPDLGQPGEQILRRVAHAAPEYLAPAVEEMCTGQALAAYKTELLADLSEAYYLDEDDDGLLEDGIRPHHWRGPDFPLAAWYRGPFLALLQNDPRRGMTVLNRLCNHAARSRARALARLDTPWPQAPDEVLAGYTAELRITGTARGYVGDDQVWCWYRGTGSGPYPCMSALQAAERWCDQLMTVGAPPERLLALLLDGCENLAVPGLAAGLLVRHAERAGPLLDPFLAEPFVWDLEFARVTHESSALAASSDGLAAPERRTWSMREVATWLALHADASRADQLRAVGGQMIAAAEQAEASTTAAGGSTADQPDGGSGERPVSYATMVRNWASALDADAYRTSTEDGVTYLQATPPDDVLAALQQADGELQRSLAAVHLLWRYSTERRARPETAAPVTSDELAADLVTAKDLLRNPPAARLGRHWDAPAAVAAAALEANLLQGMSLPGPALAFAVTTLLAIADGCTPPDEPTFEESYFEDGAGRAAARTLPLLLLPAAAPLREACGVAERRIEEACRHLARAVPNETRLYLARGLDAVWDTPCRPNPCHHQAAFGLAVESMRDCQLGGWENTRQRSRITLIGDPVTESLAGIPGGSVLIPRLDAAVRALGTAAVRSPCVAAKARNLLLALLDTQRRGLLAGKHDLDQRGTRALIAARALLNLAAAGDDAPLHEHLQAYADNGTQLGSLLRALAAAAEESRARADAARRIWPAIVTQILELEKAGHHPFSDGYFGQAALAALIPAATYSRAFMYREVEAAPLDWTDALAWRPAIEAWLPVAAGCPPCADSIIALLQTLPVNAQAEAGLPWITAIAVADTIAMVKRSHLLSRWLTEIRPAAADTGMLDAWQQLADALVVVGDTNLAPYSE